MRTAVLLYRAAPPGRAPSCVRCGGGPCFPALRCRRGFA